MTEQGAREGSVIARAGKEKNERKTLMLVGGVGRGEKGG